MKKLIIARHAKSSWEYDVVDHERPLNDRGLKDAHKVSNELKDKLNPELVLSSDALRARSTANIFISNLNIDTDKLYLNHDLYDFSGEKLIKVIKSCNDIYKELMIFGHNHAITYFVNKFGDKHIDNVPTSGVVIIEFDILNWKDLKLGKTINTIFPRDLKH
ncbi:SixA phosphatase family protein [Confluentibacter sediminis]|uniref:SixA phosphatase family protein n=1 Tax=Confluentibacter sediminis TaxID=2219045 RepID=UPI000DAF1BE5|nr:histidine phosphatase family protein [Confluentibacter sediminis]